MNIFSHSVGWLFTPLLVSLAVQKLVSFIEIPLTDFYFGGHFEGLAINSLPSLLLRRVFTRFSSIFLDRVLTCHLGWSAVA